MFLANWQVLDKMRACNKPQEMIQLLWVNPQFWGLWCALEHFVHTELGQYRYELRDGSKLGHSRHHG